MQKIVLHPSGREVECASGDTVLAALEKKATLYLITAAQVPVVNVK